MKLTTIAPLKRNSADVSIRASTPAASTGTDPSVIDLATKTSTAIHAGTEGNALSIDVKANKIYFVGYEDNFLTAAHRCADLNSRTNSARSSSLTSDTAQTDMPSSTQ